MGREKWDDRNESFDDKKDCCSGRNGAVNSLMELIFGIVSFSITLAFKVVEVVFQILFGLLSGIGSASRNPHRSGKADESSDEGKQKVSYTVRDIKQEAAEGRREAREARREARKEARKADRDADNVRNFRQQPDSKVQAEAAAAKSKEEAREVHNKDFYIFLFILTIIPTIVALAMGKLLYAGIIGAAGFGLMILTGVIAGIAGSFKKKAAEQKMEEDKEESQEADSVEKLIKDAFEKLFVIRKDIDKISDAGIKAKLEAICSTGEKIIGEVRTNPEGLTHVRKFFYYYLDAFGEIVKKYLRLSSFEESSEEVGRLVAETERSFTDIDGIFKDLCEKLLEKDMMNLKAEINVIRNSN